MSDFFGGLFGGIGSILGADINAQSQQAVNAQNIANQKLFAQNAIQWKVADARAAGISPLAALGAPEQSFTNVVAPQPGAGMAQAGQSLGRAMGAVQSPEERAQSEASTALSLEHQSLQNDLLRSQLSLANQAKNPPMVDPKYVVGGGSGIPTSDARVVAEPDKPTMVSPNDPAAAAGMHPDYQLVRTADGGITVAPPKDIAALGFFHPASLSWYVRNGFMPAFDPSHRPKDIPPGYGFNPASMTYSPGSGVFRFGGSRPSDSARVRSFGAP